MDEPEKSALVDIENTKNTSTSTVLDEHDTEHLTYKDSTYEIVSKVAYLLGVPKRIFENEHEAPKLEVYEKLEQEKAAKSRFRKCAGFLWPQQSHKGSSVHAACTGQCLLVTPCGSFHNIGTPLPSDGIGAYGLHAGPCGYKFHGH